MLERSISPLPPALAGCGRRCATLFYPVSSPVRALRESAAAVFDYALHGQKTPLRCTLLA